MPFQPVSRKRSGLRLVSQKRFGTELAGEVTGLEKYKDSLTQRLLYKGIRLEETDDEVYL